MKTKLKNKTEEKPINQDSNKVVAKEAIDARAYELASARNFEPGHEMEDWLQAEKELSTCGCKCLNP